jgi:SPP1 family predicted phage head-tail adaptor
MKKDPTGAYNKRITLLFPNGSTDPNTGEPNYSPGATIWSAWDVKPPSGRVIQVNNMETPLQTRWIKIRYTTGITADWRIKYVNDIYDINQPPIDMGLQHREIYLELRLN